MPAPLALQAIVSDAEGRLVGGGSFDVAAMPESGKPMPVEVSIATDGGAMQLRFVAMDAVPAGPPPSGQPPTAPPPEEPASPIMKLLSRLSSGCRFGGGIES